MRGKEIPLQLDYAAANFLLLSEKREGILIQVHPQARVCVHLVGANESNRAVVARLQTVLNPACAASIFLPCPVVSCLLRLDAFGLWCAWV